MASFNIPKVGPPPAIGSFQRGRVGFPRQQEAVPTTPEFGPGKPAQGFLGDLGTGLQVGGVQAYEMATSIFSGFGTSEPDLPEGRICGACVVRF